MKKNESLLEQIVKATRRKSSEEETHKLLEELNQYRKKLPPFEATIFR